MTTDAQARLAQRQQRTATRREAVDDRWRQRAATRRPVIVAPDPEPGWLDGPRGLVRAVALLIAAALLGAGWALLEKSIDPPAAVGPRA